MRTASYCMAALTCAAVAAAQDGGSTDSRPAWVEDLDHLATELPKRHKNLFHTHPAEAWAAEVAALRARLPGTDDAAAVVELRRLVARLRDAHTVVLQDRDSKAPPTSRLPLALCWVKEGLLLWAVPKEHGAHAGRLVTAFGGVPWEEAVRRVAECACYENDAWMKVTVCDLMLDAATLRLFGLADASGATTISSADDAGKVETFSVRPPRDAAEARAIAFARAPDFKDLAPTLDLARKAYGRRTLPESKTLFVWYDACRSDRDRPLAEFLQHTLTEIDAGFGAAPPALARVVIDLRRNSGGDSALLDPFIGELARRPAVNHPDRLRVLVGRRTFSSAVLNAHRLRKSTFARLYGEPTGGALNCYGEVKTFRLPRSGLLVQYCTKYFRCDPTGPGLALEPDVAVAWDAATFRAGKDPVFEAAIR
jgi:hypothetical protein